MSLNEAENREWQETIRDVSANDIDYKDPLRIPVEGEITQPVDLMDAVLEQYNNGEMTADDYDRASWFIEALLLSTNPGSVITELPLETDPDTKKEYLILKFPGSESN